MWAFTLRRRSAQLVSHRSTLISISLRVSIKWFTLCWSVPELLENLSVISDSEQLAAQDLSGWSVMFSKGVCRSAKSSLFLLASSSYAICFMEIDSRSAFILRISFFTVSLIVFNACCIKAVPARPLGAELLCSGAICGVYALVRIRKLNIRKK